MKEISKPWGHELWIEDGTNTPYAMKRIFFKAGSRTSLQVHKFKTETNYILSGTGRLFRSKEWFDVQHFLVSGMTVSEVEKYESTFDVVDLYAGVSFNIQPGYVHRVMAITDLEFFEVSTPELDDVFRLQDDAGRIHGRVHDEHQK